MVQYKLCPMNAMKICPPMFSLAPESQQPIQSQQDFRETCTYIVTEVGGKEEKQVDSEIQKRPYNQICVINTISSKMFILMFTHDCLGWFINCHHVVIYYYFEMNRQIIHFLLLQKFFINSISCRLYGLMFCFEHTEPILYVFCIF